MSTVPYLMRSKKKRESAPAACVVFLRCWFAGQAGCSRGNRLDCVGPGGVKQEDILNALFLLLLLLTNISIRWTFKRGFCKQFRSGSRNPHSQPEWVPENCIIPWLKLMYQQGHVHFGIHFFPLSASFWD